MNEKQILDIFGRAGAIITNSHIVYTSGKHGTAYVNKDALYPHTRETSQLCLEIAERFVDDKVKVVVAPAVGGVILSQWVAFHLTKITGREVLGVYAEREVSSFRHPDSIGVLDAPIKTAYAETGRFIIKRGYDKLVVGERSLVVEDIINTGHSIDKTIKAVRAAGGDVVVAGSLCNRGGIKPEHLEISRLDSLVNIKMDAWDEVDCPLCKQNVPINTDVGHGRAFLAQKKAA